MKTKTIIAFSFMAFASFTHADDTEIFVNAVANPIAQVLIIMDTSGSMDTKMSNGKTRMEVAKDVTKSLLRNNADIQFGLMTFENGVGATLRAPIQTRDATQIETMTTVVDGFKPSGSTPLCESLWEAYLYLSGQKKYFGKANYDANGNYQTPLLNREGCDNAHIVVVSDGLPNKDYRADDFIKTLYKDTPANCGPKDDDLKPYILYDQNGIPYTMPFQKGQYLPYISKWMKETTDLDCDAKTGLHKITTHFVGMEIKAPIFDETAKLGGGVSLFAADANQLYTALDNVLNNVRATQNTFVAPAIGMDNFSRAKTPDAIFVAAFAPSTNPRWNGNLKKFTMADWMTDPKYGRVEEGGAGELLAKRLPSSRKILTDTANASGQLEALSTGNKTLISSLSLAGVANADLDKMLTWATGADTFLQEGSDPTAARAWIMGDVIHAEPVVVNYGVRNSKYTMQDPDIRVVVGTNHGFLHMFNNSLNENWAIFLSEFADLLPKLQKNSSNTAHDYGIDGMASVLIYDANQDGNIVDTDGDRVYLYFGLRRGGRSYYALDISNPDAPKMLWRIKATGSNATAGFSNLGYTFAKPVVSMIPGYTKTVNNVALPAPVVILSGGYDLVKDQAGLPTTADSMGNSIYVVDAFSGQKVWGISTNNSSATNLQETRLTDSIATQITALDSNGDNVSDRLYFPDTGGNIWRVDMPGNTMPANNAQPWSIFKLASLGSETDIAADRRFFTSLDVVRTRNGLQAYDALLIGSGNRAHPNDTNVSDAFFMIKDKELLSMKHAATPQQGKPEVATPKTIAIADLYNATLNLVQDGSNNQQSTAVTDITGASGWYIGLNEIGEKTMSTSTTYAGRTYFTSYVPAAQNNNQQDRCGPPDIGDSYLWGVSLHNGAAVHADWNGNGSDLTGTDRKLKYEDSFIPALGTMVDGDGDVSIILPEQSPIETEKDLTTRATYWFKEVKD